jgi:hypothetical protein
MNATLAYAADRSGCLPCKGMVLASNAIGLSLLLAPAVWYQGATLMNRILSTGVPQSTLATLLVPHIIAVPSELMLALSAIGAVLALYAAHRAHALAVQGISSRRWSLAIAFAMLCNVAAILSNVACLLQV